MAEGDRERLGSPVLVIGYGNTLRRDDGVGPRVAEAVAERGRPGVEALALHQLSPELAEPLATARLAIFVDARLSSPGEGTRAEPLGPSAGGDGAMGHSSDPGALLALALAVYGRCPEAWMITIPASDLGLGEELSPTSAVGLVDAINEIDHLLDEKGSPDMRSR